MSEFNFKIKTIDKNGDIVNNGNILLYNTDDYNGSRNNISTRSDNSIYFPTMTKMGILDDKGYPQNVDNNFIGIYSNTSNAIGRGIHLPLLLSIPYCRGNGEISILYINGYKIMAIFTAKMSVAARKDREWLTQYLQVLKPNVDHILFPQFISDSIVYSIFNDRCRTYSMRNYLYKERKWDVKNEFFWLSREYMMKLAEENNYYKLYKDAYSSQERYIVKMLCENNEYDVNIYSQLSPDAKEILDIATTLVELSFPLRQEYEENHLYCWDCGYEQLKRIWREHFPEEFKIFRNKYKEFGERLRPLVYELGFLKGEPLN